MEAQRRISSLAGGRLISGHRFRECRPLSRRATREASSPVDVDVDVTGRGRGGQRGLVARPRDASGNDQVITGPTPPDRIETPAARPFEVKRFGPKKSSAALVGRLIVVFPFTGAGVEVAFRVPVTGSPWASHGVGYSSECCMCRGSRLVGLPAPTTNSPFLAAPVWSSRRHRSPIPCENGFILS